MLIVLQFPLLALLFLHYKDLRLTMVYLSLPLVIKSILIPYFYYLSIIFFILSKASFNCSLVLHSDNLIYFSPFVPKIKPGVKKTFASYNILSDNSPEF